jgi:polar amino acid transport system permease protein
VFQPFLIYLLIAGVYFLLCFPLSWWSRVLERRIGVWRRTPALLAAAAPVVSA